MMVENLDVYIYLFCAIAYMVLAHVITEDHRKVWREGRRAIIKEKGKRDICLELVLVDFNMLVSYLFYPLIVLISRLFCKN